MFSEYKEKLTPFHKLQVRMFRAFGVYGLSPDTIKIKKLTYELYFAVLFFWVITYNVCLSIELIAQPTILDKIVKVFYSLAAFIGATFKLFYIKKNGSFYKEPVSLLNVPIFAPVDAEENAILDRSIKLSKRIQNFYCWLSMLALIYVLVSQKIADPQNLPVAAYNPFGGNYLAMQIFSFSAMAFLCSVNIAYDLWCTSFLIFITAQLEILGHRLKEIGRTTSDSLAINRDLKNCFRHYGDILKFVGIIEKSMTLPVSVQMCCSVSILCSNFYAMSFVSTALCLLAPDMYVYVRNSCQFMPAILFSALISNVISLYTEMSEFMTQITSIEDDVVFFVRFFMFQMAMLSQIFLLCYFSNEVTLESLRLSHAVYSSNWITWDATNRRLMILAMMQFQNPIRVRSVNRCYAFDLNSFSSIVNTSYSYFILLKNFR